MRREQFLFGGVGELHHELPYGLVPRWGDNLHVLPCGQILGKLRGSGCEHLPALWCGRLLGRRRERVLALLGGDVSGGDGCGELYRVPSGHCRTFHGGLGPQLRHLCRWPLLGRGRRLDLRPMRRGHLRGHRRLQRMHKLRRGHRLGHGRRHGLHRLPRGLLRGISWHHELRPLPRRHLWRDPGRSLVLELPPGDLRRSVGGYDRVTIDPIHLETPPNEIACRCGSCAAGLYSSILASACAPCAAGTFSAASGLAACATCGAGTYAPVVAGAASCSACAAGKALGTTGSFTATDCLLCPAGTFSAAAATLCASCDVGAYSPSDGLSNCTSCPAGTYLAATGAATISR